MEENWDSVHEQNVTKGLRLSDSAQVFWLLVTFTIMITAVAHRVFLAAENIPFHVAFSVLSGLLIVLSVFVTAAIKTTDELFAFNKINKRAHDDGQKFMKNQPFSSAFVFNLKSPIIKRLYGKR